MRKLTISMSDSLSLGQERKQNMKVEVPYRLERLNHPAQANWEQDDVSEPAWRRPVEETQSYENRIFSCLVVYPPGRALYELRSVLELLEAFRDFIKGPKSLVQEESSFIATYQRITLSSLMQGTKITLNEL